MRIIAGKYRGRKLATIEGRHIRPTSDRVREALFNILAHKPKPAAVLDLYCGTGALGLEALSRGATRACFIDNDNQSISILRKNVALFKEALDVNIIRWDASASLDCLRSEDQRFDLTFIDPPYARALISQTLRHLVDCRCMASGGIIVAEHAPDETIALPDSGYKIIDHRRYGKTRLTFLEWLS